MKHIFIKLNKTSSLYKALKERNLIDDRNYLHIFLNKVPRINESFAIPYGRLYNTKKNNVLEKYLLNRKITPIVKVTDLIINEDTMGSKDVIVYYLKCEYIKNSLNWL